jgi:hypothetical protein
MKFRLFLALVALPFALVAPAAAQRMADGETLDRILPDIRAAHPGRLSDAEPWIDDNGRTHYRIKWMTPEGRILYFDADAHSGRYSSSGGERDVRDGALRPNDSSRPRDENGPARPPRDENGSARPARDDGGRPPNDDHGRRHDNWNDGGPFGDPYGGRGRDSSGRGGDWRGNGDSRGGDWRGGRGASDSGGWHHHGRD